jgi:hypothetical protein
LTPKGGTEPERDELVIRGPFPGANFHLDSWFSRDNATAADADNFDNLFGDLQTRPGIDRLIEFVEIGTSGVIQNRPLGDDKSLLFVDTAFATSPTDTDGICYGKKFQGLADVTAVGKWYQRDCQSVPRFAAPPGLGTWGIQRYKVVHLGGHFDFTNANPLVSPTFGNVPTIDIRIIGGYIRNCSDGAASAYNTLGKIITVSVTGVIVLSAPWAGPTLADSEYAIFLPISDVDECHLVGPSYFMGSDFCTIESYEGSARLFGAVVGVGFPFDVTPVNPGASAEFTRLSVFELDVPGVAPGMNFRFIADPVDQTRGIVRVGQPYAGGPAGEDVRDLLLWPPYTLPLVNTSYEILQKIRYWVTGAAGSTIVSPGTTGVPGQFFDDPQNDSSYVANAVMQYADRIIIATDMSYGSDLNPGGISGSVGPNMRQTFHHPGVLACSSTLDFRRMQGPTSALYQLDIGPINWLFNLREVGFAISTTGIVAMTRTGIANDPLQFQKLMTSKRFVPWAKPVVVKGTYAVILATDDVCLFDGAQLHAITGKLAETYRHLMSTGKPQQLPTHVFYEQNRGRVFISRGTSVEPADPMTAPGGNLTVVSGTNDGEGLLYRFPDYIGGHAEWSNDLSVIQRNPFDTEGLIHTTGRTKDSTGDKDFIAALRWTKESDENAAGGEDQISWGFTTPWFDFDGARFNKEVSRVRIVYIARGPLPQPIRLRVIQDDGTSCDATFDLATTVPPGDEKTVMFTGSTVASLVMTGFAFKLRFNQFNPAPTPFFRPIIQEIGITWEKKMELEQF